MSRSSASSITVHHRRIISHPNRRHTHGHVTKKPHSNTRAAIAVAALVGVGGDTTPERTGRCCGTVCTLMRKLRAVYQRHFRGSTRRCGRGRTNPANRWLRDCTSPALPGEKLYKVVLVQNWYLSRYERQPLEKKPEHEKRVGSGLPENSTDEGYPMILRPLGILRGGGLALSLHCSAARVAEVWLSSLCTFPAAVLVAVGIDACWSRLMHHRKRPRSTEELGW
jgi:hypothetical protein